MILRDAREKTDRGVRRARRTHGLPALITVALPCALAAAEPPTAGRQGAEAPTRAVSGTAPGADRITVIAPPAVAAALEAPRLAGQGLLQGVIRCKLLAAQAVHVEAGAHQVEECQCGGDGHRDWLQSVLTWLQPLNTAGYLFQANEL